MNNNLQAEIEFYNQYVGKELVCLTKKLPILIVKSVVKHPFKQKAAYKFENIKETILCENCVESSQYERDIKLENLKKYIDQTIYFTNESHVMHLPAHMRSNNTIDNFYKVKSVYFNKDTSAYYFVLNNDEIKEAKDFKLFKHSECFYTDFKYWDCIEPIKWFEMFNVFQTIDESLLCFDTSGVEQEYKVRGFALTNYSHQEKNEWHLLSILYDTKINGYTYNLNKFARNLAEVRDKKFKIENRSLFFFLTGKVFEFSEKEDSTSLKTVSNEIKWVLKNHILHEKLKDVLPNKPNKVKKNKI